MLVAKATDVALVLRSRAFRLIKPYLYNLRKKASATYLRRPDDV